MNNIKTKTMGEVYRQVVHHWNKIISVIDDYLRIKPDIPLEDYFEYRDVSWGADGCVYCKIFICTGIDYDGSCVGCPIAIYSGYSACEGTPWEDVDSCIKFPLEKQARKFAIRMRDYILRAKPSDMDDIVLTMVIK